MRLYEGQCVYCNAYAVLNNYCRQCESTNPVTVDSKDYHAPANSADDPNKQFPERSTVLDPLTHPTD